MLQNITIDSLLAIKSSINSKVSLPIVTMTDAATGMPKYYAVKTKTEYISGFFSQLENGNVLKTSNKPLVGVRSLDGKKLGQGINQEVFAVRVLYDTKLEAETEAALQLAKWEDKAPEYAANGEFRFYQNSELLNVATNLVSNKKAAPAKNDDDFLNFTPFVVRECTDFDINFKLAGAPETKHAYRIEYVCLEFVETDKA